MTETVPLTPMDRHRLVTLTVPPSANKPAAPIDVGGTFYVNKRSAPDDSGHSLDANKPAAPSDGGGNPYAIKPAASSDSGANSPTQKSHELPVKVSAPPTGRDQQRVVTEAPLPTPTVQSHQRPVKVTTRRICRCGAASVLPVTLTCLGQRCPCFVAGTSCKACRCKGCRNPVDRICELWGEVLGADGADKAGDDGKPPSEPKTYVVDIVRLDK
ncbi:hypothetical protein MTO96_024153 [Rhipicephalus appendiculatus]